MVTIIADNYFGYCKKEVKTQISFAANLYGLCEEEHAGGAIAFPTYVLGQDFVADRACRFRSTTFDEAMALLGDAGGRAPRRLRRGPPLSRPSYTSPKTPSSAFARAPFPGSATARAQQFTLRAGETYVLPSGYRVRLEKQAMGTAWRLVGTRSAGTLCHKPCTVSGGGKSEISKSIADVLLKGPVFVRDYHSDMEQVAEILKQRFLPGPSPPPARPPRASPHPQPGALAGLRHQAADPIARIHR